MKRLNTLFLVAGLMVCMASVADAQVIIGGALNNGDLDATVPVLVVDNPDPDPDLFLPKPSVWENIGTRAITGPYEDELSSEPWAGPAPTPVTTNGNGFPGPDGCNGPDCAVFFKPFTGNTANGAATGHLQQDNPALPGRTYTLTGWAGAEPNALMTGAEFAVEFLDAADSVIGGSVLSLLPTLFVDNGLAFDYKQYSVSALAPPGTVEVRARASMIGATGNPLGGGQAFVVDDFTLTAVPEPATALLVMLGAIGCGLIRRR